MPKGTVVAALDARGLRQITRLRKAAARRSFYEGPPRASGSGRPQVYDGNVAWQDKRPFEKQAPSNGYPVYPKVLNSTHFKRTFRVVVLVNLDKPEDAIRLAATDRSLEALTICRSDSARDQREFVSRDGKPYTGLADCQARDEKRLEFHFNAALTTPCEGRTE